jgi:hypothetical protein
LKGVKARSDGWQEFPPLGSQQKAQGADNWQLQTYRESPRRPVVNQKAICCNFQAEADGLPLSCPQ